MILVLLCVLVGLVFGWPAALLALVVVLVLGSLAD